MRKKLTVLQVVLAVLFIGVGLYFGIHIYQDSQNAKIYDDIDSYRVEDAKVEEEKEPCPIDFKKLRKKNKDIYGWITIPKTNIDYPIVQGSDNDHYLNYAYDGSENWMGSIFMDYRNKKHFTDRNTVVYGHYLTKTQNMFSRLNNYLNESFYKKHKKFTVWSFDEKKHTYRVYSAYLADETSVAFNPEVKKDEFQGFIDYTIENERYKTSVTPTTDDRIITLVCCYSEDFSKRVVVHAVEVKA